MRTFSKFLINGIDRRERWPVKLKISGGPWRRLPPGSFSRPGNLEQASAAMEKLPLFACGEFAVSANDIASAVEKERQLLFSCFDDDGIVAL